ncbi:MULTISPECIES: hypothetical protein [Methylophaga]|uniref:Uncharacterized protein n=1 Tax=Methylophaga muralis TaxID=291169 RepID=A0A1E3GND9_9GAMM|nr:MULTISPECIES: hypothetical protein [Methylophaga]ODN65540.1 hypothetical protein A9E74_02673 [Methylophaga muralis]THK42145.1 hypothetical protein E8Q33_05005 [Methylophaga sp. SB9B]
MDTSHVKKASTEWASLKKEATLFPIYSMRKAWDVLEKQLYGLSTTTQKINTDSIMQGKIEMGKITVLDPRLGNLIHSLEYTRLGIETIQSPPVSMILEYIQACERVHWIIDNYRKLAS